MIDQARKSERMKQREDQLFPYINKTVIIGKEVLRAMPDRECIAYVRHALRRMTQKGIDESQT